LIESHLKTIKTKYHSNWASVSREEDFLSLLQSYIRKTSPAPWWPSFFRYHDYLNNIGRWSPQDYIYAKYQSNPATGFREEDF